MELDVSEWLNVTEPPRLADLRGRVVMVVAFQMHCQGCIVTALPQAQRVHDAFKPEEVTVLGLHCVFENHAAADPDQLRRFVAEQGLTFPIAIDTPTEGHPVPQTMRAWQLGGTPTIVLFDHAGRLRLRRLGHAEDLRLGAMLGQLLTERGPRPA